MQFKTPQPVWSVFVPTTPNPTIGFLIFIALNEIIRLDLSVADAIRSIISLEVVGPEHPKVEGKETSAPTIVPPAE